MVLPNDLVSQFVKATNDSKQSKEETTVFGTTVEYEGRTYVRLDGSELLTPVSTTAKTNPNERVTVMIKNHTATITGNVSSPAARTGDVNDLADEVTEVEVLVATKASIDELNVQKGRIDELVADNVIIKDTLIASGADIGNLTATYATITEKLTAAEADIDNLQVDKLDADVATATYATIENLNATNADVHNLEATYGDFQVLTTNKFSAIDANINTLTADKLDADTANITYAKITDLDAINGNIANLKSDVADIDTLIFGSASGDTIHISFANAVIAQLGNAQIKSAMIESVSADKITAGDIITNNVRVKSEDGKLLISDETIQISDDTRVRVQIGKDASNDYSINIWDADGNLMFSQGGITDSAIKDAIIRNDMVSDTANIAAHKLDIDSLFEEINGSSKTIKSTKIYLDDKGQTLDVAFEALSTEVTDLGETITSQGTQISTIQGQISSKVWQQDIDTASNEMSSQYSTLEQEVDNISATVAEHTTEIDKKADSTTVTTVTNRVSTLETGLSGFQSTVSSTYATKTEVSDIEIGGRNLLCNSGEVYSNPSTTGNYGFWNLALVTYSHGIVIEPDREYTLSYDWSVDWGTSEAYGAYVGIGLGSIPGAYSKDILHSVIMPDCDETHTNGRFVKVFSASESLLEGSPYFAMRPVRHTNQTALDGSKWSITNLKLEKGNKATDWTPAPEDVQADIDAAQAAADAAQATANQNAADMAGIVTSFNADVQNLQTQIDGSITTWFYEVAPTETNEPVVNWTTTELKNVHLGDLYYDTITGYCYRWQVLNNVYAWQRITDTDVTKALSDAQAAQDTADQKRRVFYTQPTTPYDKGDLWVQGSNGDILRCQTAKTSSQSYSASDWVVASKYTDDTVATTANNNALAAQSAASNAQNDIDNLEVGGRNYLRNSEAEQYDTDGVKQEFLMTTFDFAPFFDEYGLIEATLSFDAYVPVAGRVQVYCQNGSGSRYSFSKFLDMTTEWARYSVTFTPTGPDESFDKSYLAFYGTYDTGRFPHVRKVKLEKGNRATDWTPAPEDIQEEVAELTTRVVNAETSISQNTEAIGLRATKDEVTTAKTEAISTANTNTANMLAEYSTTSEMEAAIQLTAEGITNTVSSTYATKSALEQTNTNVETAQSAADAAQADVDALSIGGTNLLRNTSSSFKEYVLDTDDYYAQFGTDTILEAGQTYTFTVYVEKATEDTAPIHLHIGVGNQGNYNADLHYWRKSSIPMGEKTSLTYTVTASDVATYKYFSWRLRNEKQATTLRVKEAKLEKGNRATDWSPCPKDIDTRVTSAESSITQLSNSISTNVSETSSLKTRMSTVEQTADGLTTRLDGAEDDIVDAAKTATNYMNFSSSGLVVGDMTASSLGKNVLIDSDSVDIRNGTTTLASFGANEVVLGQNAEDSVINLCDGAGKISANTAEAATAFPYRNAILIESQEIETASQRFVTDVTNSYGVTSTPSIQNDAEIYMLSNSSDAGSFARMAAQCMTTSSGDYMRSGVSSVVYDEYLTTHTQIYALDSTDTLNRSNKIDVYPHKTIASKPIFIDGVEFCGSNKVLWSGGYYMSSNQTATLSEAISAQANGIVLVWSYYVDGANDNSNFHFKYIPKHFVSLHNGKGTALFMTNGSLSIAASKYVYISNTSISGYSGNNATAAAKDCGITSTPKNFVLRYVIGV